MSSPVNVFCWLGWKQPTTAIAPHGDLEPVRELRPPRRESQLREARPPRNVAQSASYPNAPSATITRTCASSCSSRTRYGQARVALCRRRLVRRRRAAHRGRDVRVGERAARRRAARDSAWFANPARCIAANSQSPDRSPVNTRPVRLPPCAAGASPTTQQPGRAGRRSPGTGRPQYSSSRNAARFSRPRPAPATRRAADRPGTRRSRASELRDQIGSGRRRHAEHGRGAPLASRRARPAHRQRHRVVGDRPQAGDHPEGAGRRPRPRGRGDVAPRPRRAARARGRDRGRRGGRGARRRRHAQRGRRRARWAPTPRSRRSPAAPRTSTPARSASPRRRSTRPASCSRRWRKSFRRIGLGADRPALPVPLRGRLRRRGGRAGRALRRAQALRRAPAAS